ncbi:MAG: hypothetical protein HY820_24660 [Acidobacteria bacterium]|nr:hypothetical protein [Acidobacteriota bacterium]
MKFALLLLLAALPSLQSQTKSADLVGTWDVVVSVDQEIHDARLVFKEDAGKLTGRVQAGERDLELLSLKAEGDTVSFSVTTGERTVAFTIKVTERTMDGTLKVGDQTGRITGKKS